MTSKPVGPISKDRKAWLVRNVLPHERALRNWLERKAIANIEVDDIVQETYAILAGRESVEDIRSPKNYAFQTAYSLVIDQLRRARIVSFRSVADVNVLGATNDEPSPEQQVASRDELRHVVSAIAQLPEKCREVFTLRRVEGLSQREIADRLGISVNTVEKHVAKGVRQLMDIFGRGGKGASQSSKEAREGGEPVGCPGDQSATED